MLKDHDIVSIEDDLLLQKATSLGYAARNGMPLCLLENVSCDDLPLEVRVGDVWVYRSRLCRILPGQVQEKGKD